MSKTVEEIKSNPVVEILSERVSYNFPGFYLSVEQFELKDDSILSCSIMHEGESHRYWIVRANYQGEITESVKEFFINTLLDTVMFSSPYEHTEDNITGWHNGLAYIKANKTLPYYAGQGRSNPAEDE